MEEINSRIPKLYVPIIFRFNETPIFVVVAMTCELFMSQLIFDEDNTRQTHQYSFLQSIYLYLLAVKQKFETNAERKVFTYFPFRKRQNNLRDGL